MPLDWAATQNNLGNALLILAERERSTQRLKQAVAAYRAALEVFAAAGLHRHRDMVRSNLARTAPIVSEAHE